MHARSWTRPSHLCDAKTSHLRDPETGLHLCVFCHTKTRRRHLCHIQCGHLRDAKTTFLLGGYRSCKPNIESRKVPVLRCPRILELELCSCAGENLSSERVPLHPQKVFPDSPRSVCHSRERRIPWRLLAQAFWTGRQFHDAEFGICPGCHRCLSCLLVVGD